MAEREGKLKLESLKRQLLNEVFEEVAKKITALSDENYQAFIEKQLTELPKDMKVVAVIPADRVAVTKKALKAAGINVSETEDAEFAVGVVLRGTDFEYDLSLERILGELKSKKDMEIASELFSD
jgi:vacuolar-type H+-ATPase subunit E/Vma4